VRFPLQLSLQFADPEHRAHLPRHRVAKWIRSALQGPGEITVRIVGAEEGQLLNRDYRGKDYATNVLTFSYAESEDDPVAADIVLCCPVVEKEAKDQKKPLQAHYAHLIVHGALHAQGYDHEDPADAEEMEGIETQVLADLGFPDPYASR
jgi:probable rRNA maturation factor